MVTWSVTGGPGRIHKKNVTRTWPLVKMGNCWIQVTSITTQADVLITNKDYQVTVNASTVFNSIKDNLLHNLQFPGKFLYRICLNLCMVLKLPLFFKLMRKNFFSCLGEYGIHVKRMAQQLEGSNRWDFYPWPQHACAKKKSTWLPYFSFYNRYINKRCVSLLTCIQEDTPSNISCDLRQYCVFCGFPQSLQTSIIRVFLLILFIIH